MSGLELNKIAASILLASLIAMIVGLVANILYKPKLKISERGYQIEISEKNSEESSNNAQTSVNIEDLMAKANADAGAKLAKKCISCHTFEEGGVNKIGPNLWNIVNASKGKHPGFKYSKVMLSTNGTWNYESLFAFLRKPSKYMPGTKMSFAGIRNPQDIAHIIAYLKSLSTTP